MAARRAGRGRARLRPADLLFTQGFGTRRECAALVAATGGSRSKESASSPTSTASSTSRASSGFASAAASAGRTASVRSLVLHKPSGHECSLKPRHHPSVYALLPTPLRARGVQAVGRLDEDTTGVLLFTDDGTLLHRLTSPKHHVAKVYDVRCRHALDDGQLERLRTGVLLHDENETVRAACEAIGERALRLVLTEGKYHQVKRMVAAAGNRVEALQRIAFGGGAPRRARSRRLALGRPGRVGRVTRPGRREPSAWTRAPSPRP